MALTKKDIREKGFSSGSALILVVVLTSLLAILAVMFMLSSRVDKITAAAISGNKELDFGVDSVMAKISQQLVDDVNFATHAYYDYPDANNPWLANLEPVNGYSWRQISDIYGRFVPLSAGLIAGIAKDYQDPCDVGDSTIVRYYPADADGDGVSDSVWVALPEVTSSKGKPIYAAVRVIDNGGMLNVNTAYLFDPNETNRSRVDGSNQMQINLMALAGRDSTNSNLDGRLFSERFNATGISNSPLAPADASYWNYTNDVVWRLQPIGTYTPFDISDELKLRNRYILNYNKMTSRIEELWTWAYDEGLEVPRDSTTGVNGANWVYRVNNISPDPCDYDYRHISTTYNMDRLIAPDGAIMANANAVADANVLYERLLQCIDANVTDTVYNTYSKELAQIAANIKDSSDGDAKVTIIYDRDRLGVLHEPHYGFEQPCIFISELAYKLSKIQGTNSPTDDQINWSYGIELSKLYPGANGDNWRLRIAGMDYNIPDPNFFDNNDKYTVLVFEDKLAPLAATVSFSDSPDNGQTGVDTKVILNWPLLTGNPSATNYDVYFGTDYNSLEFKGNQTNNFFKPATNLNPSTDYYWRIDYTDNGIPTRTVLLKGDVWKFTTWASEPNYILQYIDQNTIFLPGNLITLERQVKDSNGLSYWLTVDSVIVDPCLTADPCGYNTWVRSLQRDMSEARWIKHLWGFVEGSATLGHHNDFNNPGAGSMQARPAPFDNTGDIATVFSKSTYYDTAAGQGPADAVGYSNETEEQVRIDLRDPNFQRIFQYVSAFGHADSNGNGRVKGRININTAPWYVIAQLPWVSQRRDVPSDYDPNALAQAIVAYRDKLNLNLGSPARPDYSTGRQLETTLPYLREEPGFNSIAELAMVVDKGSDKIADIPMNYYDMRYYVLGGRQNNPQMGFPDLTFDRRTGHDDAPGDMEKLYLIFSRISDLVTVRSDVFTAYILVRVGNNGPQKRVIAILDRSEVTPGGGGKVKVIAVHPVPDPR
jgi:hypothetical protein